MSAHISHSQYVTTCAHYTHSYIRVHGHGASVPYSFILFTSISLCLNSPHTPTWQEIVEISDLHFRYLLLCDIVQCGMPHARAHALQHEVLLWVRYCGWVDLVSAMMVLLLPSSLTPWPVTSHLLSLFAMICPAKYIHMYVRVCAYVCNSGYFCCFVFFVVCCCKCIVNSELCTCLLPLKFYELQQ